MSKMDAASDGKSLDAILDGFSLKETRVRDIQTKGVPLTLWVPQEYKDRYTLLQKASDRRFSKFLRNLFQAAIDRFDEDAA